MSYKRRRQSNTYTAHARLLTSDFRESCLSFTMVCTF